MDILDFINNYWSVLAFIGVVLASWFRYEAKNNNQDSKIQEMETRIVRLEADYRAQEKVTNTLKVDLAEIKTILQFLKEKLDH